MEKVENVELFNGDKSKPHVIVNTEWGALGDDGTLNTVRTQYDFQLDKNSLNSGKQTYVVRVLNFFFQSFSHIPPTFGILQV